MNDCFTCIASCHQGHLASQVQALYYLPSRGIVAEGSHLGLGYKEPARRQAGLRCFDQMLSTGIGEVAVVSEHDGNPGSQPHFTKSFKLSTSLNCLSAMKTNAFTAVQICAQLSGLLPFFAAAGREKLPQGSSTCQQQWHSVVLASHVASINKFINKETGQSGRKCQLLGLRLIEHARLH